MKKLNTCDFLILGIGILAVCFSISFIANCKLDLETDFLSAAATLFAAAVAIVLFNDWRDQYKVESMERFKYKIFEQFTAIENSFDELFRYVCTNREDASVSVEEYARFRKKLNGSLETLRADLDYYEKIIHKFKIDNLKSDPVEVKRNIDTFYLSLNPVIDDSNFRDIIIFLRTEILPGNPNYAFLRKSKITINNDLQKVILDSLDK